MGYYKQRMIEEQDRGYGFIDDRYVCKDCFQDYAIRHFIDEHLSCCECSYCGRKSNNYIAADMDIVMGCIARGLATEWDNPVNGVGWEGEWVGCNIYSTPEVLSDAGIDIGTVSKDLLEDIVDSLGFDREWCRQEFYGPKPSEVLSWGWEAFVRLVKHSCRYVFFRQPDSEAEYEEIEEIPPQKFLDAFGDVVNSLDLYIDWPVGTQIYRIRTHNKSETPNTAAEIGPPRAEFCKNANRMSPAGIPMFYGAYTPATCCAETLDPNDLDTVGTVGKFRTTVDMTLLDLTILPPTPSIFDEGSRSHRHAISFMRNFLRDFTRPIAKDGYEHIEYVPTQVVAEYVRYIQRRSGESIDGILYPSAACKGETACVLFMGNYNVADPGEENDETLLVLLDHFSA